MSYNLTLRLCTSSTRGASLPAAIAAMAILSLTMFTSIAYIDLLTNQNSELKQNFSISLVKSNILRDLQNSNAWLNTVNDPNNLFLACTADPANCLAVTKFIPLNIRNIENQIVVAGTAGSWYDYAGKVCSMTTSCPVQVKAQWRGVCNNEGTCTQAYVELDFLIRDKTGTQTKSKVSFLKNYFIGTKTSTITTNVTVTAGDLGNAKAKIIVILDSSESMIDNFAKVKSGLTNMMTKLAGKDVAVYFYTTAGGEIGYPGYAYNQPQLRNYYLDVASQYTGFKKVASFDVTKGDDITYNLNLSVDMSRKIGAPIDPTLSATTIQSRMESIFSTYVAATGTDKESGLCTLHRILTDTGPNQIIGDNDLAFFIIVSDEDDLMLSPITTAVNCHKSQKVQEVTTPTTTSTACNYLTETCDRTNVSLALSKMTSYVAYTQKTNDTTETLTKNLCNYDSTLNTAAFTPCPYTTAGKFACSAKELSVINPDGTKIISYCQLTVKYDSMSHNGWYYYLANTPDLATSFCSGSPFSFKGISYLNLQDWISKNLTPGFAGSDITYCQLSATKVSTTTNTTFKATSFTQMDGTVKTSGSLNNEDRERLATHLVSTLNSRFGTSGYAVKAYIQDPIKDLGLCSLTNGAYGSTYTSFINRLNNSLSGYESICNSNYDVSFDTLSTNILSKINNTYIFNNMTSTDKIIGISITRSGSSFTLEPNKYEVVSNKVIFHEGALQEGDQITALLDNGTTGSW